MNERDRRRRRVHRHALGPKFQIGVARRKPKACGVRAQDDRVAAHRPLAPGWAEVEWRICFANAWRSGTMVQAVGELHAAELACEYAARRVDLHGSLLLELLDARAAIGALAKGRSSAWPFLRIFRRVAALSIATGMEFCPRWISSEEQPADAASRWFQVAAGHDWKRGRRLGEADRPEPPRRRPLRGGKLAAGTLVSYLIAFLRFSAWCESSGWAARVPDVPALEFALMDWMEELHEDGVGPHIGNCALGAIRVLSRRIHGELVDARALHRPPIALPLPHPSNPPAARLYMWPLWSTSIASPSLPSSKGCDSVMSVSTSIPVLGGT